MYRDVLIQAVLNGWKVQVGCQEVVFTNATEMLLVLKRYYEEPEAVERDFLKTFHAKHVCPSPPPGQPAQGCPPIAGLTLEDSARLSRRHHEGDMRPSPTDEILKATR